MQTDPLYPPPLLTRRHTAIMLCLTVLLAGVYWFTYSGKVISQDELFMFDAAESLARRGNSELDIVSNFHIFTEYPVGDQPHVTFANAEPLQILAGALLFALADATPNIGLLHTVWLLNVIVCALTGAVFFLYARLLGYSERIAVLGTLVYALGTILWPYSKTFFREPLAALLLFGAALCLNAWRERWGQRRNWLWLIGFGACYLLALFTKEAALLVAPALLAIVFPRVSTAGGWRRLATILAAAAGFTVIAAAAIQLVMEAVPVLRSYNPLHYLQTLGEKADFIGYALLGYLVSPGRSLFAFSPVLLLALPGLGLMLRARRWREALTPLLMIGAFVVGYAVVRNDQWFGGQAWGPRFLVPVTPFAMLAVLPVLQKAASPGAARWVRIAVVGVIVASVLVQVNGILLHPPDYFEELGRRGVIPWQGGTWDPTQSPLFVNVTLLNRYPLDLAWLRAEGAGLWLPLAAILLAASAGITLRRWLRRDPPSGRRLALIALGFALGTTGAFYVGLRSIDNDPRYLGGFAALRQAVAELDQQARPEDILVLSSEVYQGFFYNYYRNRDVLVYTLPMSVGERPSPEQPPLVESNNPDLLIEPRYSTFLTNLPEYTDRVWVLESSGPFTGFTVRPVEWFMARHYFPLASFEPDQSVRLLLFDVNHDAPPDQAMRWPEHLTDAQFGTAVELVGYDLPTPRVRVGPFAGPDPRRTDYAPGEVIAVSLLWRALETPSSDYNVGVYVVNADGVVVAQRDSPPQATFRPMNTWQPGETVRDNHALLLPADLSPGTYALWVKVYAWQTGENQVVSGENRTAEGQAAQLTMIRVR